MQLHLPSQEQHATWRECVNVFGNRVGRRASPEKERGWEAKETGKWGKETKSERLFDRGVFD